MSTLALGSLSPNIERRKLGRFLTGSFSLKSSDRCLSGSRPWRARDLCLIMGWKADMSFPRQVDCLTPLQHYIGIQLKSQQEDILHDET